MISSLFLAGLLATAGYGLEYPVGQSGHVKTTGSLNYLIVPVQFRNTRHIKSVRSDVFNDLIFNRQLGVSRFFEMSSKGKLDLAGSTVAAPLILPKDHSDYISSGAPWELTLKGWYSHQRLLDGMEPILERRYDLSRFYGLIVLPNVSDGGGHGSAYRPLSSPSGSLRGKNYPVIFIDPESALSQSNIAHEVLHHLDISHYFWEAGLKDPFKIRTRSSVGFVLADLIAWHKKQLGWVEDSEFLKITGTKQVRIPARNGSGSNRFVQVTMGDGKFLTLESVLPAGYDRLVSVGAFGVMASIVFEEAKSKAALGLCPQKFYPAVQSFNGSPVFPEGSYWKDIGSKVRFKVLKVTQDYCDVLIEKEG